MTVKAGEKLAQVGAGESPLKGSGGLLVVVLEGEQTLLEFGQGGEIIGSEDLALNDGEVDLDLIEPTGMDRGVDEERSRGHAARSRLAAFSPRWEEPLSVIQKTRRAGNGMGFCHRRKPGSTQGRSNGWMPVVFSQRPKSLARWTSKAAMYAQAPARWYFVLDAGATARCGRERRMDADAGLDAGFLVRRQDKVTAAQRRTFPAALVKVKHATGLHGEIGIAREDPAAVSPRAQPLAAEPAPAGWSR